MASYPQQKLMTDILHLSGFIVREYSFIESVGLVLYLKNTTSTATCPKCGSTTDKLHQNYQLTLRDLGWAEPSTITDKLPFKTTTLLALLRFNLLKFLVKGNINLLKPLNIL